MEVALGEAKVEACQVQKYTSPDPDVAPQADSVVVADKGGGWVWTRDLASELQETVDLLFGSDGKGMLGLEFSFSLADPLIEDCPLVGCSSGFSELCGYSMEEIVGRNCKFLVDPVPGKEVDQFMRRHARAFCEAAARGVDYRVPADEWEPWMPTGRSAGELWCVQRNARKNGELFNNMFYLKVLHIGGDIEGDRPVIVGLQSELPGGKAQLAELVGHVATLDRNMSEVESNFAQRFFLSSSMCRLEIEEDGFGFCALPGFDCSQLSVLAS